MVESEEKVFKQILVNEETIIKNLEEQIRKASEIFKIETPNGRIIFNNIEKLNNREKILAFLLGKYFAKQAKVISDDAYPVSTIAREIGEPMTALSGHLKTLQKENLIVKLPDRRNRINPFRIDIILNSFSSRTKKGK